MTQAIWTTSDLVSSENSVKLILFKLGLNFGRFPGSWALYRFVSEYDVISGYLSMTDCLEWLKINIKKPSDGILDFEIKRKNETSDSCKA